MSTFKDYKSYKQFAPQYEEWRKNRDLEEEKRRVYLEQNPSEINQYDIKKSKTLLRAIDIMDEYSQKRAEDTEVATEQVVGAGLEIALFAGAGLGVMVSKARPVQQLFKKLSNNAQKAQLIGTVSTAAIGALLATAAAFPLYAWAARAEVNASRKGRFEAMTKELNDPKTFAVLTPEQEKELEKNLAQTAAIKEKKSPFKGIKESWEAVKGMVVDSDTYRMQKQIFAMKLAEDLKYWDEELNPEEIETAKKDQQLLTKLVEKLDIASQDYAENAELATSGLLIAITGFGSLFNLIYSKIMAKMGKKASSIPGIITIGMSILSAIFAASIQKQAARVGRFKAKQELMNNPEQLVYVSDEKTGEIKDVQIPPRKKQNLIEFLSDLWKNNKEYNKWEKTEGAKEKNIAKAIRNIEITDEQLQDAKRLQHNTFKTFNKLDAYSQKYSESIEALGQALLYPVTLLCSAFGALFGAKYLIRGAKKGSIETEAFIKYLLSIIVSAIPVFGIQAYITSEQKKASRVANMLAIDELADPRNFADYSRFKK